MNAAARKKRERDRKRRYRAGIRRGDMTVKIRVTQEQRDRLVDAGVIGTWDENNSEAVRTFIQEIWDGGGFVPEGHF